MHARVALVSAVLGLVFATGATAATITGSPDPATVCDGTKIAQITVSWNAADANVPRIEVHVGSATGSLFAAGGTGRCGAHRQMGWQRFGIFPRQCREQTGPRAI
jgi:hypothetical protein